MDKEELRKNYQQLTNKKVVEIAMYNAVHLSEDAKLVLKEEIERRGLSDRLINSVNITEGGISDEILQKYLSIIRNLPDPTTGETGKLLNATILTLTTGIPFLGSKKKQSVFFGTNDQIIQKLERISKITSSSGWLGLPFGLFTYMDSVAHNEKMQEIDYSIEPSEILVDFVKENIGLIDMNIESPDKLLSLLKNCNMQIDQ